MLRHRRRDLGHAYASLKSGGGPTEPDGLDLTGVELTIRRISLKILDQQL